VTLVTKLKVAGSNPFLQMDVFFSVYVCYPESNTSLTMVLDLIVLSVCAQ
jgi:hypothetical protein